MNSIRNLSLSDPRCNNDSCLAFQAAHNLSQASLSYYYQYEYGHFTVYYYTAIICIAFLFFIFHKWQDIHSQALGSRESQRPTLLDKLRAYRRFVSYHYLRFSFEDALRPPPVGMLATLLLLLLFLVVSSFAVRPYYRQHRGYGSPPLGVRTGLMAAALTPLLVALGGKVNIVTLLTGISYERLNVIHRWVGWFCLGLSVVHTVPSIVAPMRDGGYGALHAQYYKPGGFEVRS